MSPRGLALLAALLLAGTAISVGAGTPADRSAATAAPAPRVWPFDETHSSVGFHLRTRWGQRLRGAFPVYEGEVRVTADGRREVRVLLDSTEMVIAGHPRYTRWARGEAFFDVARFPTIGFRSETYDESLLHDGGALHGTLTMRGVSRPVRFQVEPAGCDAPGIDCDVVASGVVDRTAFGMDDWRIAVDDSVHFELRVRTHPAGGAE